ncbi:MAG: nucleoside deaminase [Acutalibacteraceae bacterium]|nr:nucleoside deaminase [Acutalibacteraceae bacterium]
MDQIEDCGENELHTFFMNEAIKEAELGIAGHEGGPFGCVVVKDGKIVGRGHNQVIRLQDATCHGEMQAIRDAARNLHTFNLYGCVLYTTAEPCPMCLGAVLWSNISEVYYGCDVSDTEKIGFRDDRFYRYINGEDRRILVRRQISRRDCLRVFERYNSDDKRTLY